VYCSGSILVAGVADVASGGAATSGSAAAATFKGGEYSELLLAAIGFFPNGEKDFLGAVPAEIEDCGGGCAAIGRGVSTTDTGAFEEKGTVGVAVGFESKSENDFLAGATTTGGDSDATVPGVLCLS
jgi:hypothetical protein